MTNPTNNRNGSSLARNGSKHTTLFRIFSILLGITVGLALCELFLALTDFHRVSMRTKRILINGHQPNVRWYLYSTNPAGEFTRLPPQLPLGQWRLFDFSIPPKEIPLNTIDQTPWSVEERFSSQGLRDRQYTPNPAPGVLRIAAVGDSFTFGEGVPLELSLTKQVEQALGTGFEVVNGGSSGTSTSQHVLKVQELTRRLACDRALVVFIINDIEITSQLNERQDCINDLINIRDGLLQQREAGNWYSGHSNLLYLFGSALEMRRIERETMQWYRDMYDEQYNAGNLERLQADFQKIASTPECRVALVIYPLIEGLEREYPFRQIHRLVGRMAREAGMPVLDLAPEFEGQNTTSLQVHPTDHHPNGKAHALAAKKIAAWLTQDVPGFLERDIPATQSKK